MDENLRAQIETYLTHLDGLIRRGREFAKRWRAIPPNARRCGHSRLAGRLRRNHQSIVRRQQGPLAGPVIQRGIPDALGGRPAVEGVAPAEIVKRLLERTRAGRGFALSNGQRAPVISAHHRRRRLLGGSNSSTTLSSGPLSSRPTSIAGAPSSRRTIALALLTSCGILEAIVTDALEHKGLSALACIGRARGEDFRLVVRDAACSCREGRTDSRRVRPAAGGRADVSRQPMLTERPRSDGY